MAWSAPAATWSAAQAAFAVPDFDCLTRSCCPPAVPAAGATTGAPHVHVCAVQQHQRAGRHLHRNKLAALVLRHLALEAHSVVRSTQEAAVHALLVRACGCAAAGRRHEHEREPCTNEGVRRG